MSEINKAKLILEMIKNLDDKDTDILIELVADKESLCETKKDSLRNTINRIRKSNLEGI